MNHVRLVWSEALRNLQFEVFLNATSAEKQSAKTVAVKFIFCQDCKLIYLFVSSTCEAFVGFHARLTMAVKTRSFSKRSKVSGSNVTLRFKFRGNFLPAKICFVNQNGELWAVAAERSAWEWRGAFLKAAQVNCWYAVVHPRNVLINFFFVGSFFLFFLRNVVSVVQIFRLELRWDDVNVDAVRLGSGGERSKLRGDDARQDWIKFPCCENKSAS